MNGKEIERLEAMRKLAEKRVTQKEIAKKLSISERQVKRLWKRFREKGAEGVVSERRGKPSNNQMSIEKEKAVVNLLHSRYVDFGPTLTQEKLFEENKIQISVWSVRKIMIEEGIWKTKKIQKIEVHQMRERRACFGELIQIDGSPYNWFERRAPKCTLIVFINDATGMLVQLLFANSPQARGRVERANQTLQDRLTKELRLRGISDWEAGNAFLPEFMEDYNYRFAVEPKSLFDAHRQLSKSDDLARIFTLQVMRTLTTNLTIQFNKTVYQIQTNRPSYAMRNAQITLHLDSHENISLFYKDKPLDYIIFHKQSKQSEIVQSKNIDHAIINQSKAHKPAIDHPWRQGFATHLSKSRDVPLQGDISTLRN
jgi:transposase